MKRPNADENQGEAIGFSLVYSGNFLAQVEVDTFNTARIMLGIHPQGFSWQLKQGEAFQTPEAVLVYSCQGMNGMSQTFHSLYRSRLARGAWRDRVCPILINNWEATYFDFDEDKLVRIASKAKEAGVELFVLDDGWFSTRRDDYHGLGDWWPTESLLPNGIKGLAERINGRDRRRPASNGPEDGDVSGEGYSPTWQKSTVRSTCLCAAWREAASWVQIELIKEIPPWTGLGA